MHEIIRALIRKNTLPNLFTHFNKIQREKKPLLPLKNQNRRWPSRSPPGSFLAGGQICTPRRCVNMSLSGIAYRLPGSATWCPVWRRCSESWRRAPVYGSGAMRLLGPEGDGVIEISDSRKNRKVKATLAETWGCKKFALGENYSTTKKSFYDGSMEWLLSRKFLINEWVSGADF